MIRSLPPIFLFCLASLASFGSAPPPNAVAVSLVYQHDINCIYANGAIKVAGIGGDAPYSYLWSTGASADSITGLNVGTYTVTVTDMNQATASMTYTIITNFSTPTANAGPDLHRLCSTTPTFIQGGGSSGGQYTYAWASMNDGVILTGGNTLTPGISGNDFFELTITDLLSGCVATDVMQTTSTHLSPFAKALGGVLNCVVDSVTLQVTYDTLHTIFEWTGPGMFSSKLANPVVSTPGAYLFNLTDTLTSCLTQSPAPVIQNITQPNLTMGLGGTITCAQQSHMLSATSTTPGATFNWSGPGGFTSNQQHPVVFAAGTYTVTVTNPINGCTRTGTETVTLLLTAPVVSASNTGVLTCLVDVVQVLANSSITSDVSYAWSGPSGFSANQYNPFVDLPGVYRVTVTYQPTGCTGAASVTVLQNSTPPQVTAAGGGTLTCANPQRTLTGSSTTPGVVFQWTGPFGFVANSNLAVVSAPGVYTLKVTNPINGCTQTASVSVSQNNTPPNLTLSPSNGLITCLNPTVSLVAASTTPGATFLWSGPNNFSSTQGTVAVSLGGVYVVTATDPANGCTSVSSLQINQNTTPPYAYAGEDKSLNCNFTTVSLNGSFSSSGPNFVYNWTTVGGSIVLGSTTPYLLVNAAGWYFLKVTNTSNGCFSIDSAQVFTVPPVQATITANLPVFCAGAANGSLTVTATGGSFVYNYLWSNGKTTAVNANLSGGAYTVTVTDNQGCSANTTATVQEFFLSGIITSTPQTTPNMNNGTATTVPSGGTPPYGLFWSNGQTTTTITGLAPGAYTVTISDSKGCTKALTTNVAASACPLNGSITAAAVKCFGTNTGSVTTTTSGASNPTTYLWSNGATSSNLNNVGAGTYTVTITDALACQLVLTATVGSPPALNVAVSNQENPLCHNSNTGSLTAGVSGGTQPYSYKWSNTTTNPTASSLVSGTYTITVSDNNLCTATATATIIGPPAIQIAVTNTVNAGCQGAATGSLTISASGGTGSLQYFWSNGANFQTVSNISAGSYTVTVTDANNCTQSLTTAVALNDQLPPVLVLKNATLSLDNSGNLSITAGVFDNGSTDIGCGIATWTATPNVFNCSQLGNHLITITATDLNGNVSSGTATLTVKDTQLPLLTCPAAIQVEPCNNVVTFPPPTLTDNCTINPAGLLLVSGQASGSTFTPGTLTNQKFRYTDAGGNTVECTFQILVGEAVAVQQNITHTNCGACDGKIVLTQTGGSTSTFNWSNGQNGKTLQNLCAGNYTVTITDADNCTSVKTYQVTGAADTQIPVISCPPHAFLLTCMSQYNYPIPTVTDDCPINPSALVRTSGPPPNFVFPVGETTIAYRYTDAGGNMAQCSFIVTVTGAPNLNAVINPASCYNVCNGSASLNPVGGTPPFTIQWSNGSVGLELLDVCSGVYKATVTDAGGCSSQHQVYIPQPPALAFAIFQVINDYAGLGIGSITIVVAGGAQPYSFQWTKNGQPFSNLQNLQNLTAGTYQLVITDANECAQTGDPVIIQNTSSVPAAPNPVGVLIQPNPAADRIHVSVDEPNVTIYRIELGTSAGQLMATTTGEKQQATIPVQQLPPGWYWLRIQLSDGRVAVSKLAIVR